MLFALCSDTQPAAMATQSLLHEILLALLGHTGACIAPLIEAETAADASSSASSSVSASAAPRFVVSGLVLAEEVPFVTPAERAAINQLLQAGFAYVRIMHFVQNIDAGATVRDRAAAGANTAQSDAFAATAAGTGEQSGGHVGLRTTLASTALEQRALDAQQARHVYAAAGAMFSPPKKQRPARDDEDEQERGNSMALVPLMEPLHPLLDTPVAQAAQPKGQTHCSIDAHARSCVCSLICVVPSVLLASCWSVPARARTGS